MHMATGHNIRKHRLDRGWTLEELSERSGVQVGTISSLEVKNSRRSKHFKAIADALSITLDELESGHPPDKSLVADPECLAVWNHLNQLPERTRQEWIARLELAAAQEKVNKLGISDPPAMPQKKQHRLG